MRFRARHSQLLLVAVASASAVLAGENVDIDSSAVVSKDASVEGQDGVAHTGPLASTEKSDSDQPDYPQLKAPSEALDEADLENGVTIQEKARQLAEEVTGEKPPALPEVPKEAPLPPSEEEKSKGAPGGLDDTRATEASSADTA